MKGISLRLRSRRAFVMAASNHCYALSLSLLKNKMCTLRLFSFDALSTCYLMWQARCSLFYVHYWKSAIANNSWEHRIDICRRASGQVLYIAEKNVSFSDRVQNLNTLQFQQIMITHLWKRSNMANQRMESLRTIANVRAENGENWALQRLRSFLKRL